MKTGGNFCVDVRKEIGECGKVLRLVWPLALGMANNAVMQFVDRVFLAQESESSLKAVLPAAVLSFLFICSFQSLVSYSGVFVAQFHGARDRCGCFRSYFVGLALAAAALLCLCGLVHAGEPVFRLFAPAAESDLVARENAYFTIVTPGGAALCAMTAASGYFTGLGRTRLVFWVNLAGNLLNAGLDYVLIFGLGPVPAFGIAGAAAATVASQAAQAAVLNFMALREWMRWRGSAEPGAQAQDGGFARLLWRVVRFGVPSAMYQLLNFLSFTIFVMLTDKIGGMELAVSNACFTVNYLLIAPVEGFSIGAATIVGQCKGAGDVHGAAKGAARAIWLALAYAGIVSVLVLVFHDPVLRLFIAPDSGFSHDAFVSLGFTLFLLMSAWQLFDAADVTLSGALKGAGDTLFVMLWMLVSSFLFWMPILFWTFYRFRSMAAIWSTMVAYVVFICVGSVLRWKFGHWRRIQLIAAH